MSSLARESGSFRDRRGNIFYLGDRVLRSVMPMALADFEFVRASGLIESLSASGMLIAEQQVDKSLLGEQGRDVALLVEHPRLPFISYPYEWPFSALKAAALLHLDLQQAAIKKNVTLTDASAYNVQFVGARPIFIDSLSLRRYRDGEYWQGHRQFCEQFLNPLLLGAIAGVAHHAWYRGSLEGISAEDISRVLPWRSRFSWNVLTNVFLQARFQRSAHSGDVAAKANMRKLPRIGFEQMLHSLRKWISGLELRSHRKTVWQDYAQDNSYSDDETVSKRAFVADFVTQVKPRLLLDIGCNSGDYAALALQHGAGLAVGFDFDHGAIEHAYRRARNESLNFLPLHLDAANPSPAQGWSEAERMGFAQRARGDAVIGLALVHHLAIAKNLPLNEVIQWLLAMAPQGVLEFVPRNDAMVQRLLQLREDIFDDYDQPAFEQYLGRHARIVKSARVSASGRMLYWFDRG